MTPTRRAPTPAAPTPKGRGRRPADFHPLLAETHDVWLRSRMNATEAAPRMGVSTSTIYGWFAGRGRPMFTPLDTMMYLVGHRYTIVAGLRPGVELLPSSNASGLRRAPAEDLHPIIAEADKLWRKSGVALDHAAAALGLTAGPLYGWFTGKTDPGLLELDGLLALIGFKMTVLRGVRPIILPGTDPE